MAIVLDGTNGITTPSEDVTGTGVWSVGGTQLYKDTNGNLGLGVTPSAWGSGKAFEIGYTGNAIYSFTATDINYSLNAYYNGTNWIYSSSNPVALYSQSNANHIWQIAPSGTAGSPITLTQAMTLDNNGNLLVGYTSLPAYNNSFAVNGFAFINRTTAISGNNASLNISANDGNYYGIMIQNISASNTFFETFVNSTGSPAGSIQQTSSTTVAYNTTSDQRLKTDLGLASQSRILDVKIHDYEWKSDGSKARGVFAQEAYEVIPEAVSVGTDELNENGKLVNPWQVDYSKFVPDLIVMVQEQQEMINQLKAEIAELKGAK